MSKIEDEKTGVAPASKAGDSEITNRQSDDYVKSEDPITKPAPARLPARASQS